MLEGAYFQTAQTLHLQAVSNTTTLYLPLFKAVPLLLDLTPCQPNRVTSGETIQDRLRSSVTTFNLKVTVQDRLCQVLQLSISRQVQQCACTEANFSWQIQGALCLNQNAKDS